LLHGLIAFTVGAAIVSIRGVKPMPVIMICIVFAVGNALRNHFKKIQANRSENEMANRHIK